MYCIVLGALLSSLAAAFVGSHLQSVLLLLYSSHLFPPILLFLRFIDSFLPSIISLSLSRHLSISPSVSLYLPLCLSSGIASYRLDRLEDAEDALHEVCVCVFVCECVVCVCTYICMCVRMCMYVCTVRERERECVCVCTLCSPTTLATLTTNCFLYFYLVECARK